MTESRFPRYARAWAIVVVVLVVGVVVAAFYIQATLRDRAQESCERTVQAREDNRTMWIYLLAGKDVDHDDPKVVAFTAELNKRLPPLECVDRVPVPVGDE